MLNVTEEELGVDPTVLVEEGQTLEEKLKEIAPDYYPEEEE